MEGISSIPSSVCNLQTKGHLLNVWADCNRLVDPVQCECCTVCCNPLAHCTPINQEENDDDQMDSFEDDSIGDIDDDVKFGR